MSLPPALLARLAQRGLVQKQKEGRQQEDGNAPPAENEEVIAEDYDEMDTEQEHGPEIYPSPYDHTSQRKRNTEDSFWLERMRARMGESTSIAGYKGCPNKYNIWHKCTLFCVNRWEEGIPEPSRDYMRRYKRLLRKYPLPKGWTEIYDPGCGCYYFYSAAENLVSWLPPTHPKSQVSKSAAVLRRQMEEAIGSDGEQPDDDDKDERDDELNGRENAAARHQREIDEIINSTMRPRSPPPKDEEITVARKPKSRDLERVMSRQRRDRERDRDYERDRDSSGYSRSNSRRYHGRDDVDILDPMDPSAYSDTPRGKWSTGLNSANEERTQKSTAGGSSGNDSGRDRRRERRDEPSDDEDDYDDRRDSYN